MKNIYKLWAKSLALKKISLEKIVKVKFWKNFEKVKDESPRNEHFISKADPKNICLWFSFQAIQYGWVCVQRQN